MPNPFVEGDRIVLVSSSGRRHLVVVEHATQRVGGLGVVNLGQFVGAEPGATVRLGDESYTLLKPSLRDALLGIERKAQLILPKDASRILVECGVGPGSKVGEAGVGSAGLTIVLAFAVGTTGRVYGYDVRGDHLKVARGNLERAGLIDRCDLVQADVTSVGQPTGLDAFVLDVPEPAPALRAVVPRLAVGASVACYTPLVGQMEAARAAMAELGLAEIRSLELLERSWISHDRGSRPDMTMLGHTGFLTFGRRVLQA